MPAAVPSAKLSLWMSCRVCLPVQLFINLINAVLSHISVLFEWNWIELNMKMNERMNRRNNNGLIIMNIHVILKIY